MGHYYLALSVDTTIISGIKNRLSTGKHLIIFVAQHVTIGAAWPAKTPLILDLSTFNLRKSTAKPVFC